MADPLSITTSAFALLGVVLKVSMVAIGMVDKTTGAHEAARDALTRNLRRALQNLNKGTSNIQTILHILISDPKDKAVKKLLALPEGEVAVKELCESLESTRGLLAERAGQAQLETTGLEPLPQDRRSLAFVQAVFKHNFSPSNIEDAIIALKDFQFDVESCQQTTELAFQQVWRVYDIVRSRTRQSRSSGSTISLVSTQIPESSTSPQATTSFRKEIIDWLKGQDIASKSNLETPYFATQTGRAGTSAEKSSFVLESQPAPKSREQDLSKSRIRSFFGLSRTRQDYKKTEPESYRIVGPFPLFPPQPLSPQATEQPVYTNYDFVVHHKPKINTTTYGHQFQPTAAQPRTLSGRNAQTSTQMVPTDYNWENSNVRRVMVKKSTPYFLPPPPNSGYQHANEQPVYSNHDVVSQKQPLKITTTYGHEFQSVIAQQGRRKPKVNRLTTFADYDLEKSNVRGEEDKVSESYLQAQAPNPESQAPSATLPPDSAQAVTSGANLLDSYILTQNHDGVPLPSQPWPNRPSIATPLKQSLSLIDDFDPPPPTHDQSPGTSIQYDNDLSGVENHHNDAVEFVIRTKTGLPLIKERLLTGDEVTSHGPGKEGLQSTWKRVRPPNKPEEGIPFDTEDSIFDGIPAQRPDPHVLRPNSVAIYTQQQMATNSIFGVQPVEEAAQEEPPAPAPSLFEGVISPTAGLFTFTKTGDLVLEKCEDPTESLKATLRDSDNTGSPTSLEDFYREKEIKDLQRRFSKPRLE